jgi:hypothetical protein
VVTAVTFAANIAVAADIASSPEGIGSFEAVMVLLPTWFTALGAVMATRVRGNRVAWILMFVGTGLMIEGTAGLRVGVAPPTDPTALDVAAVIWLNTGFFFALLIPLILLLYVFPTGRFLSRRWVWAGWTATVLSLLAVGAETFTTRVGPDDGTGSTAWTIANPIGIFDHEGLENAGPVTAMFGIGLIVLILCSVPAIVVRYRRAPRDDRAQFKWVGIALAVLAGTSLIQFVDAMRGEFTGLVFALSIASIPLSVTIAITRYRLYEIDRLISRTLTYAVVLAVLGGVYASIVTVVTSLMPTQGSAAVAASTLVVAGLFNPLRLRVRRIVDRRFHRSAYEAELLAQRMATQLDESVSIEAIVGAWTDTVREALKPESASVWLRPGERTDGSHRP